MTSEDKNNVNATNEDIAAKPKRGRPRKAVSENLPEQPISVGIESMQAEAIATESMENSFVAPVTEENITAPVNPVVHTASSGCGGALKAAREAQGLSIHEVCSQLRLGIKQIQAIEQDDFDNLPQPSIVRGFIRNYARLLNIDVVPILEAYQHIVPNSAPLPLSVRSNASPSIIDKPARTIRPQRILSFFIFLILAGILAYFYINHIKPQALKNASLALDVDNISETTGQEINVPEAATETVAPSATEATVTPENVDVTPTVPATETTANNSAVASPPAAEPSNVVAAQPTSDSTIISTPTPAVNNTIESTTFKATDPQKANLVFRVSEDSWVRIEDIQGKKIFSEVLTAGSEHSVVAEKPVSVIVGNAGVTQLTIDNQPYDLTQATRGRVARIQLK